MTVRKADSMPCNHIACNLRLLDQLEENLHQPVGYM